MAFAKSKPLLFLVGEGQGSRLPNTAKMGYPLFELSALNTGSTIISLARFISYLVGLSR